MREISDPFPLDQPFKKQDPNTPFSEVVFRLIMDFYSEHPVVLGTAIVVCGHLLLTARHVLENTRGHGLVAFQIMGGCDYVVWDVLWGWTDPRSDIALLQLGANPRRSNPGRPITWLQPQICPFPPLKGERIAAFGYRRSTIAVTKNLDGSNHIDLDDEPMMAVGVVVDIFENSRDKVRLNFPCFQVSARFDSGMSGGPVFNQSGHVCGIVCSNIQDSHIDGEPISYVTTLWPMFRLVISADRGDEHPRGINYPVFELVKDRKIFVSNSAEFEDWFSKNSSDVGPCQTLANIASI